ncbi:TetR/AcrR family transcriptional regulator [Cohnella mopanensis]|uniref:TetR/AcrR family transcriptional regulator n=1 Tax=Cohnella mopanensis TaxID=2911966 RepID=UPI001EF766F9|nr:TetR/AcrR family transcriptional regulator [Cohnella mopanensis]
MPTKKEQQEYRRQQILRVALELFVRRGFYGVSTREISKAAGISSGLMFHYFDSKEHLYEELIAIGCEKMNVDFGSALANPLLFINEFTHEIFKMLEQNPDSAKMFVLMSNAYFHLDISEKANAMLARHHIIEQSVAMIVKGQEMGQFKQGSPLALSVTLYSAIQGIAQEVALHPAVPLPNPDWIIDMIKK